MAQEFNPEQIPKVKQYLELRGKVELLEEELKKIKKTFDPLEKEVTDIVNALEDRTAKIDQLLIKIQEGGGGDSVAYKDVMAKVFELVDENLTLVLKDFMAEKTVQRAKWKKLKLEPILSSVKTAGPIDMAKEFLSNLWKKFQRPLANLDKAILSLEKLVKLDPKHSSVAARVVVAYMKKKSIEE